MSYMCPGKAALFALVSKVIPNVGLDAEMAAKDAINGTQKKKVLLGFF